MTTANQVVGRVGLRVLLLVCSAGWLLRSYELLSPTTSFELRSRVSITALMGLGLGLTALRPQSRTVTEAVSIIAATGLLDAAGLALHLGERALVLAPVMFAGSLAVLVAERGWALFRWSSTSAAIAAALLGLDVLLENFGDFGAPRSASMMGALVSVVVLVGVGRRSMGASGA
jgi:hypothetical protein